TRPPRPASVTTTPRPGCRVTTCTAATPTSTPACPARPTWTTPTGRRPSPPPATAARPMARRLSPPTTEAGRPDEQHFQHVLKIHPVSTRRYHMAGQITTQAAPPTPALPDADTAYQTLFDGVSQRVFFHKLASIRPEYSPQNRQQAEALLNMAGDLRAVDEDAALKSAADASDPFVAAASALSQQLPQYPGAQRRVAQEESLGIKQAAADLAADPMFYNAVLALKVHEAAQVQAQLQQAQTGRVA